MKRVLVTCPPMLGMIEEFFQPAREQGLDLHPAKVTQVMSVPELIATVPQFDGWIIGDDPANAQVFEAAVAGKLRAAVKWGVGVDNVDFAACKRLGLPITNTPGVFGREVAVNGGVKLGHGAAQNWATLDLSETWEMGGGQSAALAM